MALAGVPLTAAVASKVPGLAAATGLGASAAGGGAMSGLLGALGLSNPIGWAALAASLVLPGLISGPKHVPVDVYNPSSTAQGIDTQKLLAARPDVASEFNNLSTRDMKSKRMLQELGVNNVDDFAKYWLDNSGIREGVNPADFAVAAAPTTPAATTATPTTSTPVTTAPTAEQDKLTSTIDQLLGLFNQQQSAAQSQDAARSAARNQVSSSIGSASSKINASLLGTSVNDILKAQYDKSKTQLDRGLARGMFNDVGYGAGLKALDTGSVAAKAKLGTSVNDLLSGYRSRYDAVRSEALDAANNFTGSGTFDLTDYMTRANEISQEAKDYAPGALLSQVGNTPLFDLNAIRGEAGTAQGALNLRNLDVIDALAKRKQANGVGRGLGTQGGF